MLTTTEYAVLTVLTVETQCVALSGYDLLKIVERTTRFTEADQEPPLRRPAEAGRARAGDVESGARRAWG